MTSQLMRVQSEPPVDLFVDVTDMTSNRPLLVVHGGPDWDHTYLRDPLLALGRQVIFVDLRGCGRSTRDLAQAEYTPAKAVADLVALLDALALSVVDLLGFSYGGLLAQRLVVDAPARVRRLIVASSGLLPVPPGAFSGWQERQDRVAAQPPVAGYDDDSYDDERNRLDAISSAATNVWQRERLPQYLKRLEQVHWSSDWSRAWPDHSLMPPARPDKALQRLRDLGKPLLLLHGRQDMTFPANLIEAAVDCLPCARAVVLDQAGHMAHVDQPEQWLAAVSAFLAEDD